MALQQDLKTRRNSKKQKAPDWQQRLVCRQCGLAITHPDFQIEMNGRSDHLQVNPGGVTFHFRCYQQAPGVIGIGNTYQQHSWFEGYSWQVVVCQGCEVHLGWRFSAEGYFYGLLAGRLLMKE